MSILSLFIFFITLVPLHTGGFYTDGARALRFLRGGDVSRFETLLMKLITSSSAGVRPRQLNREEMREALSLAIKLNSPMKAYIHYYFYQSTFDEGNIDEAENHLQSYLAQIDSIPKGVKGSVYLDATFFYAFARHDAVKAAHYWKQFEPSAILPRAHVLAAEAARCFVENDQINRDIKIDASLKEIPNMMDRGVATFLRESLLKMGRANN